MKARTRPRTHPEIQEFRRKALIEATIASLARHGVAHTTVRMICAAAGISSGLLTHYYDSKDELMAAEGVGRSVSVDDAVLRLTS